MMILGLHLTFLLQGQICILIHLYEANVEKSFSQTVLKANGWSLQCMIKEVKHISYNQTFVPSAIYMYKKV